MVRVSPKQAWQISQTNKDFFLYNLGGDNKVKEYILTNDLPRHRHKFHHFKLVECINIESNLFNTI